MKLILSVFSACFLAGCGVGLVRPDPVGVIASSTGVVDAVSFRVDGAPVDEPFSPDGTLDMAGVLRLALATDPRLQSSLGQFRQALADADQAWLLPNPLLNLAFRYPQTGGSPVVEVGLVANLAQALQTPWRGGAAEKRVWAAAAETLDQALGIVADVERTYVDAQAADRGVQILDEQREALGRLVDVARARLEIGEGTRIDAMTFQARLARILVDLAERRLARTAARLKLARLIGNPSGDTGWRLEPWTVPDPAGLSEGRWVERALAEHPQIEVREWELAALGEELGLARFAPFAGTQFGGSAEREEGSWGVGPALSSVLPIFDFGGPRREKARAELIEARHRLTLARREVVEGIRRAYTTFAAARDNLALVREELLPAEEERFARIEEAYVVGEMSATDLYVAQQGLLDAQVKVVELERLLGNAHADLARAAGGVAAGPESSENGPAASESNVNLSE